MIRTSFAAYTHGFDTRSLLTGGAEGNELPSLDGSGSRDDDPVEADAAFVARVLRKRSTESCLEGHKSLECQSYICSSLLDLMNPPTPSATTVLS